ncbi:MAG: hypothetical protein ACPG19_00905 [Saprospiraceae bacterium]
MKYCYISLMLLALISCQKTAKDFKLDLPEITFSDIDIRCYPTNEGVVIDSDSAYQVFQNQIKNDYCGEFGYPIIDFNKNTLLGIAKSANCRIADRYWNTYTDEANKKYIFQTISEDVGNCEALALDRFWVTVPKLPSDYHVEFVEYQY